MNQIIRRPPGVFSGLGDLPEDRGDRAGYPIGPGGPRATITGGVLPGALNPVPIRPPLAYSANAAFSQSPFTLAAWSLQTVLTANVLRRSLQIQVQGTGAVYVLFQLISSAVVDYSANTSTQAQLTALAASAIALIGNGGTVAGGSYEPYVAPLTAVTLICIGTASSGMFLEGV